MPAMDNGGMGEVCGLRIRQRREELRLTQTALAARVPVAQATVAGWESGKHTPRGVDRAAVARALDVPEQSLFPAEHPLVSAARQAVRASSVPLLRSALAVLAREVARIDGAEAC